MTNHSIEELKRQLDQARANVSQTKIQESLALNRLIDAKIAEAEAKMSAMGINKGDKVRGRYTLYGEVMFTEIGIYQGYTKNWYDSIEILVRKITKSGKPHGSQSVCSRTGVEWEKVE